MMQVLADESANRSDWTALQTIDAEVTGMLQEPSGTGQVRGAVLMEIKVSTTTALLGQTQDTEMASTRLDELVRSLRGVPLFPSTLLEAAELLEQHKRASDAADALDRLTYNEAFTAGELSDPNADGLLDQRFRYWRLRFLLTADASAAPSPSHARETTFARQRHRFERLDHQDHEAAELAAGIDVAVRALARFDAAAISGRSADATEVWAVLRSLIDLFPPTSIHNSATLNLIDRRKPELMLMGVGIAARFGEGIPQLLSDALQRRFEDQPRQWPLALRLDLAERLRAAEATTPWYDDTLRLQEDEAVSEDVYSRLGTFGDLARRHARAGRHEEAHRLMMAIVRGAFGVGQRKDYQFDAWVGWLGRVLFEPDGEQFVDEAAWLARLLAAVDRIPEGSRSNAPADLAALIVPANAIAAVRVFEYLVRHATASHLDALAPLVAALVTQAATDDSAMVELATDLTAEIIAPAANQAYPALASTLVTVAARTGGDKGASALVDSVARRTDSYALSTTRLAWRRGLGLSHGTNGSDNAGSSDDYGALILADGQRIPSTEVASLIETVGDIVTHRSDESADSHFRWAPVVTDYALTSSDVMNLAEAFADDARRHCEVLAALAEAAERVGDRDLALRLAADTLSGAPGDAWAQYYGGARRRAAGVTIRLGGSEQRVAACQDFVRQATNSPWSPRTLALDSEGIVHALDPALTASSIWPEIRTYLDGIAENVELADPDVLSDHGCRWWLLAASDDRRGTSDDFTASTALAELAVGHLSHPTWLLRDSATTTVVRALVAGNEKVAEALARFAQPGASDDTLERIGRCLAAARVQEGYVVPAVLEPLERTLAGHRSQVIRDLAATRTPIYRPLSPAYDITLPETVEFDVGSEGSFPYPYGPQYHILASSLDLDPKALLAVAGSYATEALAALPKQDDVRQAIRAARAGHIHPLEELAASRAAFGRVLADVEDAGMLDGAPSDLRRLLRTFDLDLIGQTPAPRPRVIPGPPSAGHDQTLDRWHEGLERRLDEYVATSMREDRVLVGARVRLTVLNLGYLEEEFVCGTTTGMSRVAEDGMLVSRAAMLLNDPSAPSAGLRQTAMPLVLQNIGLTFHQLHADWLAFRPDVALALGWAVDPTQPGRWNTGRGDVAVETVWWVDGWWGHRGRAFDDTAAQGYAVALTPAGLDDVVAVLGETTRHFVLKRSGQESSGVRIEATPATRSMTTGAI